MHRTISRRRFIQTLSAFALGLLAPGCPPNNPPETPVPTYAATPTSVPPHTPTSGLTATPTTIGPTSTLPPMPTMPPPQPLSQIAIAQVTSYDPGLVRQQVEAMLDGLGGLGDVIRPGDRVAIKPNLTGGTGVPHWLGCRLLRAISPI